MKTTANGTTAAQVEKMTRVFVARTLGSEPLWKEGDEVTFQFTYKYYNNKWEMTLRREESQYEPFKYALRGVKLLHDGRPTEYTATHSQRYTTMEKAFLHIVNHLNSNANIRDRYKTLNDWLSEGDNDGWI